VLALAALAAAASEAKKDADVVYYEPDLRLEFAGNIHPYAFAYRMPEQKEARFASTKDFFSLLQLQDHFVKGSPEAERLTATPNYVASVDGEMAPPEMWPAMVEVDPATDTRMPIKPNPNPFYPGDNYQGTAFPNNYRRAVYGLRRRRMPLTLNALSYTLNPFRRPMNYRNAPQDVLFPRQRLLQALNPQLTDIGRFGGTNQLPYQHSSFVAPVVEAGTMGEPANPFRVFRHQEPVPGTIGGLGVNTFPAPIPGFGQTSPLTISDGRQLPVAHPLPVSPYIPGMPGKFFDFYGGASKAASGGEASP